VELNTFKPKFLPFLWGSFYPARRSLLAFVAMATSPVRLNLNKNFLSQDIHFFKLQSIEIEWGSKKIGLQQRLKAGATVYFPWTVYLL